MSEFIQLIEDSTPENPIDKELVKRYVRNHDLDADMERYYAWLILSGLFPSNFTEWEATKAKLVSEYFDNLKERVKTMPCLENWTEIQIMPNKRHESLKNNPLLTLIHGDIIRTNRLFAFLPIASKGNEDFSEYELHYRRIERVLCVFAMTDAGHSYLQGFNELIFPIYYTLMKPYGSGNRSNVIEDTILDEIEALTFQFFLKLILCTEMGNLFTTNESSIIIRHLLNTYSQLVNRHLPNVHQSLEKLGINPLYYALRWFTLLFSQEHDFPNVLFLWNKSLVHFEGNQFVLYLFYLGIAHLHMLQEKIIGHTYSETVAALQHLKMNQKQIHDVVDIADEYWRIDKEKAQV